jgi:hypothetical protein
MNTSVHAGNISGDNHSLDKPVWGAKAIGAEISRSARQTHYLLEKGHIKSARRVGGRWTAVPSALRREFGAA